MIYSNITDIIKIINDTGDLKNIYSNSYNDINKDILLIEYWRDKILLRVKNRKNASSENTSLPTFRPRHYSMMFFQIKR